MIQDAGLNSFPIVSKALRESRVVAGLDTGWPAEVRQVTRGDQSPDFARDASQQGADADPPSCRIGR